MGRRSINTTKSGKFMNPTDQARKEARKRELKKNKKQRMLVRMAVLKGKDPHQLLEEMEMIDKQEFDPTQPPRLNERVLKDKRKKLRETLDRVINMYEKEDPEMAMELRKLSIDYERRRMQLQVHYEQVKNAERVRLEQIPLPDAPSNQAVAHMLPQLGDIPLPQTLLRPVHGILKKSSFDRAHPSFPSLKRKPPPPPPGPPPPLSDSEDEEKDVEQVDDDAYDPEKGLDDALRPDMSKEPPSKQRKIRFEDDATHDPSEVEKDTRLRYKAGVLPIQAKMMQLAESSIPMKERSNERGDESDDDLSSGSSDDDDDERKAKRQQRKDEDGEEYEMSGSEDDDDTVLKRALMQRHTSKEPTDSQMSELSSGNVLPSGAPPGLPPGPPPGLPPMMMRPPPLRGAPPGLAPRMLPPGPPRGRPPGIPPMPPVGVPPPGIRPGPVPPAIRLPPGPPGIPPPRLVQPPGVPPSIPPPGHQPLPGSLVASSATPAGVLSAPPSIMKPPQRALLISGSGADEDRRKAAVAAATIEAKPQIRHVIGDSTRFTPTALRIKREYKDSKGHIVKPSVPTVAGKPDDTAAALAKANKPAVQVQTKDDAYDMFMKEMAGLL